MVYYFNINLFKFDNDLVLIYGLNTNVYFECIFQKMIFTNNSFIMIFPFCDVLNLSLHLNL